jgi:hypothetical protein
MARRCRRDPASSGVNLRHRIVVAAHRPWRRWALVGGGAAALALGAWGLYSYSRAHAVSDFAKARQEREQLREENRDLSVKLRASLSEAQQLKDQVGYLSRSQQINDDACTSVRQSLETVQSESADLREQLAFYRGIVSPAEAQAGMRVFEFKVNPDAKSGGYRYDLVLIQSVRHDKRIDGDVNVSFDGVQGQDKRSLKLSEVVTDGNRNLVFSFKYFQEFSGTFRLPAGFRPTRATVRVAGDGVPEVDEDYDWAKIVQEARSP